MSRMKRLFDLAGACAGLLVFAPVMLVVSAAVLADDGWPVLFRQARVGRHRRPFGILKFRSMRDGRITRVGRVIRPTGLDELPQFLNILSGDMSAVGPRPLTQADIDRLGWSGPDCDFRWRVRPGLTGLAQLAGAEAGCDSLALDRQYLTHSRPLADGYFVALSFAVNVFGKARVRRHLASRIRRGGRLF